MDRIASLIEQLKSEYQKGASIAELRAHLFRIESALMDLGTNTGQMPEESVPAISPSISEGATKNESISESPKTKNESISESAKTQTRPIELNETIQVSSSLNDALQSNRVELGANIKKESVQDLRKAIGINDRYLFIQELFGGKEAEYELAIKTLNDFNSLAEATNWISAKLQFETAEKLELLNQFNQLLSRRFS
jgi:hypothetical protein